MAWLEEIGSLAAHAVDITAWVRQLEENAFHARITQAFAVARSHYDQEINLEAMSLGFAPGYANSELDEIERVVTPITWNPANRLKAFKSQISWDRLELKPSRSHQGSGT